MLDPTLRKAEARERKRGPKPLAMIDFVKAGISSGGNTNKLESIPEP